MSRSQNPAKTPPGPPLIHRVAVASLSREEGAENLVRLSPDAEARDRIARFLDIVAVEKMTLTARLVPVEGGWEARGQLTATVLQSCVVTLDPVRGVIDAPVRRRYLHEPDRPDGAEQELDEEDLDPPDRLDDHVDLGQLAVETLALNLDPWPRAEGAEFDAKQFGDAEKQAREDGTSRPFAGLAELKSRLSGGRD